MHSAASEDPAVAQAITVRRPQVDPGVDGARYWLDGDPFRSLLLNSLSMMFPAGEQFFMDSVREFPEAYGEDPVLRGAVEGFIAQEAIHRQLHRLFNDRLLSWGYRNRVDRWLRRRIFLSSWFDRRSRLGITIAYEHFTALLGELAFRHEPVLRGATPDMALLWRWHCAEETEHRSVAYDVYRAAGGGYLRRILCYLFVSLRFALDLLLQTALCLHQDKQLLRWRTLRSAAGYCLGRQGLVWRVLPPWWTYFSPRFHPARRPADAGIAAWLKAHESRFRIIARR